MPCTLLPHMPVIAIHRHDHRLLMAKGLRKMAEYQESTAGDYPVLALRLDQVRLSTWHIRRGALGCPGYEAAQNGVCLSNEPWLSRLFWNKEKPKLMGRQNGRRP